jgi:hypothetical protein
LLGGDVLRNFLQSFLALELCGRYFFSRCGANESDEVKMESVRARGAQPQALGFYRPKHQLKEAESNG